MSLWFPALSPRFPALLEAVRGRSVAVVGHARPDGDCIGSQVAMARLLRAGGCEAACVNPDPVPRRLQFVAGDEPFFTADTLPPGSHAAVFVDCADAGRAGAKVRGRFTGIAGNIDHHISNDGFGAHAFVDSGSAATAEILAGMCLDLGLAVDPVMAMGLYVGIATDTGQFRFPSTTRRVLEISGELVGLGADPARAGAELYEKESHQKLALLQHFLSSFRSECGGRVCIGILPDGIFERTGASMDDTEGLVDYARSIDGVDIGGLVEVHGGKIKASLRARDPACRVDRIASRFNGGGHACAAGMNITMPFDEFYARLVAAIAERLREVDAGRAQD